MYDDDYCYECSGNGEDYYIDENGELVSACDDCPNNPLRWDDDDEAALEELGECPENWTDSPEEIEAVNSWCFAADAINACPSVDAVPLDKLCEWLGKFANPCKIGIRCYYPDDNNEDCMPTVECWRYVLTKWMEEQDAAD